MDQNLITIIMIKPLSFAMILLIAITVVAFNFRKSETAVATRGKVIADKKSDLFNMKLDKASILNFDMFADSTGVITGAVCLVDKNGNAIGEDQIRMVPRKFPSWFVFGCDEQGTIVNVDIRTLGNGDRQAIVRFTNAQKRGNR